MHSVQFSEHPRAIVSVSLGICQWRRLVSASVRFRPNGTLDCEGLISSLDGVGQLKSINFIRVKFGSAPFATEDELYLVTLSRMVQHWIA